MVFRALAVGVVFGAFACGGGGGSDDAGSDVFRPPARTIGPEGGSITSDDGRLTLEVPAGALDAPTALRIDTLGPGEADASLEELEPRYQYRLSPDGLTFSEPVLATLRVDESDRPTEQADGSIDVLGLVTFDASNGREIVGFGAEEPIAGGGATYAGLLSHFSDIALGRLMRSRFELDCATDCVVGSTLSGTFITQSFLSISDELRARDGSRGISADGSLEIVPPPPPLAPFVFTNNLAVPFMYRCTTEGVGHVNAHFLGTAIERDSSSGIVTIITNTPVGAHGRAMVACIDPPAAEFQVSNLMPALACPGAEVEVTARGFATPEDIATAEVLFVGPSRELTARVLSSEEIGAGMGTVDARLTVKVPRSIQLAPNDWNVVVQVPGEMPRRSAGLPFMAQIPECPIEDTNFLGNWRTVGDTVPDDAACTGPNAGPAWRFWADGTWTDTSPDITDAIHGRSVHRVDGTWSGVWEGAAYTITASGCDNTFGNVNEMTGTFYPETQVFEAAYTASRGTAMPVERRHCGTLFGHASIIASCRTAGCEADREPFSRRGCLHTDLTPVCYDASAAVCYDGDGALLPSIPPGPLCDGTLCTDGRRCCTTEPETRGCRAAMDPCTDAIGIEACDGPEDCEAGEACCITDGGGGTFVSACMAEGSCPGTGGDLPWRACKDDSDCSGVTCCPDASTSLASSICGIGC
ncbi:MAG: hypothetical protein AAGE52_10280 [Myxococcota bacterium]